MLLLIGRRGKRPRFSRRYEVLYANLFLLFMLIVIIPRALAEWNPYEVLGVKKDANLDQIKRAYRELARKVHPDKIKSDDEDTGRRFMEINKAFDILRDPVKRNLYDQHGETETNRFAKSQSSNHGQYRRRREHWHQNGFRTYTFFSTTSDGILRKKTVSSRQFHNDYLTESDRRPFLVFFYANFCPSCNLIESTWMKITDELAKYNVGSFTINVNHERRLARELGIDSVPTIACLIGGQLHPYYQSEVSLPSFIKFIKSSLPNNLVPILRWDSEQDRFLNLGPQTNKLSALIVNEDENLKLRYKLLAYEFRHNYRFAHIPRRTAEHKVLSKRYNLTTNPESHILVFDENLEQPILRHTFKLDNLDLNQIRNHLSEWPFIRLPRLSSQGKFDDLCLFTIPKNGDRVRSKLCVILFTHETPSSSTVRGKMIEFMEQNNLRRDDRVVFVYLDPAKQIDFVNALIAETEEAQPGFIKESVDSSILLIERHLQNGRKARYLWLTSKWDPNKPDELDRSKHELYHYVTQYKQNALDDRLHKTVINLIEDEDGPSLISRISWRLVNHISRLISYITSRESFPAVLVLISCACITSLFLYSSPISPTISMDTSQGYPNMKPQSEKANHPPNHTTSQTPYAGGLTSQINRAVNSDDDLRILELKAETYNGMVRLLKPGFRSIILLIDQDTKDILLPNFKKAVWLYRRNKTLLFGYLCLDKNLDWYRSLLEGVLGVENLNVNKKKCVGTVLSLNGFKKYLRVYHAKHHEIDQYDDDTRNDGSFLGFDDDSGGSQDVELGPRTSDEPVDNAEDLLERLPLWLDKVFDGLTKRYFIDKWPENIK